ncbi:killer cell lectin-like receptor subfamily B member 1B allele B [Nannospalax galili]|uniref:killer cell lectin-like receptor subfamily B member 1B allele B n=1 Tax=Nannospalax galili TaxID=1026970 RepID=UPI0004ED40CA|nr:killer cell lectin-like receptor subfamily B member 1B allele B [Nannospalax galili]
MHTPVVYAVVNLAHTREPKRDSPLPLPPDACQCPSWHQWALKLGCAGLILLVLSVIGLSVSVQILIQRSSIEKNSVVVQENMTEITERTAILKCPTDWGLYTDKCLFFSQASQTWDNSSNDCSSKEATLLLIQDQDELRYIQDLAKKTEKLFWIGLKAMVSKSTWKWINDSSLNSHILQITGEVKENSCALISKTNVISESCSSDNSWICQKKLKPV